MEQSFKELRAAAEEFVGNDLVTLDNQKGYMNCLLDIITLIENSPFDPAEHTFDGYMGTLLKTGLSSQFTYIKLAGFE